MRTAPGLVVAGKYKLEDLVGKGGMGEVWRAFDQNLERVVALKFISEDVLERSTVRTRFIAEAKAAARLRTPHVVSIYEQGFVEDTPFIAMELLDGEDLRARLKRRRRLTPPEVCSIVDQVAQGLRVAHREGIVHRDLKPGNVFLAREGDRETAKLLDFGVAKLDSARPSELTATGEMVGSIYYMSPEQVRGNRDLDARADIWSLGVICYRALTGRLPFKGESMGDVAVNICTTDPKPPRAYRAELPSDLDAFFDQALAREPNHRFRTATALAEALVHCCRQDLSTSPPSSSGPSLSSGPVAHRPSAPVPLGSGVKARSTLGYSPDPQPEAPRGNGLPGARSTMAYAPEPAGARDLVGARSTQGYLPADARRQEPPGARGTMAYSPDPAPGHARAKGVLRAAPAPLPGGRSTMLAQSSGEPSGAALTAVEPRSHPDEESGIALSRDPAGSEPPRPFADTVASSPGEDDEIDTSLDLDSDASMPARRGPRAPAVPDLELPSRSSTVATAPAKPPSVASAARAGEARPVSHASAPRKAPPPAVRPIAPAVAAMRAGHTAKPNAHDGPSVEPAMVRRLVGAAVAVAVGAAASSAVGAGFGLMLPGGLAAIALLAAAFLGRKADDGAVRAAAAALALVGVLVGLSVAPTSMSASTLAAGASAAAAAVALGLSIAGARMVRGELERHLPQGILIALMVLLGVAATAQLGRRAAMAVETPPAAAP